MLHNIRSLGRFPRGSLRIFSSIAFSILSKADLTPLGAIIRAWGWFLVRATVGPMIRRVTDVAISLSLGCRGSGRWGKLGQKGSKLGQHT